MTQALHYNDGSRALQAEFGSTALADRLAERARTEFSAEDRAFIENALYFFLGTADEQGQPDVSFKGGPAGFVQITAPSELAFPDFDGNGMFKSLGNLAQNDRVGLLFIAMHGAPRRLRVVGGARIDRHDPLLAHTVGAQLIVRVAVEAIFPNCPRYIPKLELVEESPYSPAPGVAPVEPGWKTMDAYRDVVPPRRPTFRG